MTWLLIATGREHHLTGAQVAAPGNAPSLIEIAHSLAQINRFTGHCSRPYSVAEHSMLVARIARQVMGVSPAVQLAALMHDAHECVTGDVASPIKQVLGPVWAAFEDAQQSALLAHYGLSAVWAEHHALIKRCDLIALATERRDLLPFHARIHAPWPVLDTPGQVVPVFTQVIESRHTESWSDWADDFEFAASELMDEAKYELSAGAAA